MGPITNRAGEMRISLTGVGSRASSEPVPRQPSFFPEEESNATGNKTTVEAEARRPTDL